MSVISNDNASSSIIWPQLGVSILSLIKIVQPGSQENIPLTGGIQEDTGEYIGSIINWFLFLTWHPFNCCSQGLFCSLVGRDRRREICLLGLVSQSYDCYLFVTSLITARSICFFPHNAPDPDSQRCYQPANTENFNVKSALNALFGAKYTFTYY